MSKQDQDIQQLFQSKLAKHESPVSADVWVGVQSGLSSAGAGAASSAGLLGSGKFLVIASIAAAIVAVVSVSVLLGPEEKTVPQNQEKPVELPQELPPVIEETTSAEETLDVSPVEEIPSAKTENIHSKPLDQESTEDPAPKSDVAEQNAINPSSSEGGNSETLLNSTIPPVVMEGKEEASESLESNDQKTSTEYVPSVSQTSDDFMKLEFSIDPQAQEVAWDFGDGGRSNQSSGNYTYTQQGSYEVVSRWADSRGEIQEKRFDVQAYGAPVLVLPNIFTPGISPGKNDFYDIDQEQSKNVEDYTIKIYSRDGDLIFESGPEIKAWDGKDRFGNPMPKGSYFALVEARNSIDQRIEKQQTIYLKRD